MVSGVFYDDVFTFPDSPSMKRDEPSDDPFPTPDSKYVTQAPLGSGAHGTVYRAHPVDVPASVVALKKIAHTPDEGVARSVLREIEALKTLHGHQNIVKLLNVTIDATCTALELELMDTDLHAYIAAHPPHTIRTDRVRMYMAQVLAAVEFVHANDYMHRDLKPRNILLDATRTRVKLADFGFTRRVLPFKRRYTLHVTTHWYRAPEIMMGYDEYSQSVDLWAVGCIMSELVHGKALFPAASDAAQMTLVLEVLGTPTVAQWPGFDKLPCYTPGFGRHAPTSVLAQHARWIGQDGANLLAALLTWAPDARITAEAAKAHRFFPRQ
jgi:serine/threonine protein kinase